MSSSESIDPDHDVYGAYGSGGGWMRAETTGGILLIIGAFLALAWANTPWGDIYFDIAGHVVGPESLHLDLTIAEWAADGLLAIFFFVVGVELKAEFVTGSLRHPGKAGLPIIAAAGGMVAPALIFTGVILVSGEDALRGWAIPTATDIAFALAVLAVVGRGLPAAMRTFLMTLAVVDDLLAITIIAIFYTDDLSFIAFGGMLIPLAVFAFLVQKRVTSWYVLAPIAIICWVLMHASG
ncbi:MAG TPA: Na+/H+ antiporter NhaA, partial [Nocardioidaceae bacterium]|nr:Na+/H+ antiporter NhaA [Nocardioidaceae bacterium]